MIESKISSVDIKIILYRRCEVLTSFFMRDELLKCLNMAFKHGQAYSNAVHFCTDLKKLCPKISKFLCFGFGYHIITSTFIDNYSLH